MPHMQYLGAALPPHHSRAQQARYSNALNAQSNTESDLRSARRAIHNLGRWLKGRRLALRSGSGPEGKSRSPDG